MQRKLIIVNIYRARYWIQFFKHTNIKLIRINFQLNYILSKIKLKTKFTEYSKITILRFAQYIALWNLQLHDWL